MEVPLELSFRHVEDHIKEEVDPFIREKVAKLDRLCDNIISCRIAVENVHNQHKTGNPHRVRIIVRIPPGHEIVVAKEPPVNEKTYSFMAVIAEAFDITERQIKEVVRKQHGQVKTHPNEIAAAIVEKIDKEEGYGFLRTIDNQQVYFHRNSVLHHDFDRLEKGTGVRYVGEMGEKGLQASTVHIVDKQPSL